MKLIDIYGFDHQEARIFLYELLAERPKEANISHQKMPAFQEHCAFIADRPYEAWYIILVNGDNVGACYLTRQNEIGIQIKKHLQDKGYGPAAVRLLMEKHGPRRYLANIAPRNMRSLLMFKNMGFNTIQITCELDTTC